MFGLKKEDIIICRRELHSEENCNYYIVMRIETFTDCDVLLRINVKVKVDLEQAMNTQRISRGIAVLFL